MDPCPASEKAKEIPHDFPSVTFLHSFGLSNHRDLPLASRARQRCEVCGLASAEVFDCFRFQRFPTANQTVVSEVGSEYSHYSRAQVYGHGRQVEPQRELADNGVKGSSHQTFRRPEAQRGATDIQGTQTRSVQYVPALSFVNIQCDSCRKSQTPSGNHL